MKGKGVKMEGFFKVDGFFFSFLNRVANLVLLNIMFILSCLPIVTIGPALAALYQVSLKSVNDAYLTVYKDYFKAFKAHFITGSLLFLVQFLVVAILGLVLFVVSRFNLLLSLPFFVIAAGICLYLPYSFALLSLQKNKLLNTIKAAFYLMLSHVAESILMFGEAMILLVILPIFLPKSLFFVLSFGFAFVCYLQSISLKKIVYQAVVTEEDAAEAEH